MPRGSLITNWGSQPEKKLKTGKCGLGREREAPTWLVLGNSP